ncbi:MAG: pilus assembly protein PilY [Cycloclasticus sp.]|nr:pilus assembly protein PilY [Cycloclasticus sp.]
MFSKKLMFLFLLFAITSNTHATNLGISSVPLFLGGAVEPNIMFTLDDSGSMQWEVMPDENLHFSVFMFPRPDGLYGSVDYTNQVPNFDDDNVHNFFTRSSSNNTVFYNPDITYTPWSDSGGTSMGDASPTAALYNPAITTLGTIDLTAQQTQNACWFSHTTSLNNAFSDPCFGDFTYWPITYFNYTGGDALTRGSYTLIEITTATASTTTFTSPAGIIRTRDEEIQNFANWFQYYRSRILAARGGVGRAFALQSTNMRVGFSAINKSAATIDGVASTGAVVNGVRTFDGTDRDDFFDNLYGYPILDSGTPLRSALVNVGSYFERTDNTGPWSETPGTSSSTGHLVCRQSYNILMTDGYWNGTTSPVVGNSDNTDGSTISGPNNDDYQYIPATPYKDTTSNTLADVGMHYWKTDLRTDLSNEVPTSTLDPAFWQHLVNFTVGLGVIGSLDTSTDWADLVAGTTNWPTIITDETDANFGLETQEKIDDLWHTAVNSRGGFFSASDPDTFATSLANILSDISDRTASASSVALNSGTVSGDSKLYQAKFDSGDWTGQLLAYPINTDGSLDPQAWNAADEIPAAASRIIVTFDGTDGQPFSWGSGLSTSQQTLLGDENTLNYLRGDQSLEESNGGTFRNRTTLLGDIVHASPTYVGPPALRYPDIWGTSEPENAHPYSTFKANYSSRQPIIYAGANDGMLHAFNADTGAEEFAYIPNALYETLPDLADPNYGHNFYVDGSPTVVDAFFAGDNAWHTVLVSGLRGGGQGIFAIDVTNTGSDDSTVSNNFSTETSASTKVLWEFTDKDDVDLGYTFGQPSIVRLQNGEWAAVFSGGYNNTVDNDADGGLTNDSTTGDAVLYIVNIETGALIKKLSTEVGSAEDPTGNNRPNGLSTPSVIDVDGDSIVDTIYAGDLFGNLWKIDISNDNTSQWKFAYTSGGDPTPIYNACAASTCTGSNTQPITTQIQVVRHPIYPGYLVLFGTGQYFEVGDNSTTGQLTQTVYAVWDKEEASLTSIDRDDLLQQEIIKEVTDFGFGLRVSTENAINWSTRNGWFMDLINTESGNTNNYGERQVSNMIVRNGRLIFTTLVPSDDPCDFGGSGWLMEINVNTGARLTFSPFDLNSDAAFNISDFVNVGDLDGDEVDDYVPVSGKKSNVGIIPTPSITENLNNNTEYKYKSGSTGSIELTVENPGARPNGRQSWRQLF